ncbi:MAG TPA: hypothetical protein ENG42_02825 [Candidatus Aenigmarchaeota archaeon]|nr:hypothetical protein [Candidatus Aenigmarchaeota archaeon]
MIYSYLFSNTSRLVSYGWDGNSYKRGWDANKVNVTIPANNWTVVTLKNFINASKGVYTLRIRAIDDNRRIDITKKVRIEQKKEKPRCYISYNNESLNFTQSAACALILNDPEGNVYIYNKNSSHMFNKSGKYTILIINQGTIKRYTVTIPTKKNKYRQGYRDVSGAQVFTFKNIAEMIFIYIASLIRFWMGP